MNLYLLTYFHGNRFVSEIVDAQGIANITGRSHLNGTRCFKAYLITPSGVYPVQLSGAITAVTVLVSDPSGRHIESADYCGW